jgi:inward rectifier potassium channel
MRDFYHAFLQVPWSVALIGIVGVWLAINALFACAYLAVGGIENARRGSFIDAFYFSVHTLGTIGYGSMYPTTHAANLLVVIECMVGLLAVALATGLVFAKFSRTTARVVFTRQAVIGPMDGVPTMMWRVGNERKNRIVEATVAVSLTRKEFTREGMLFYRTYDLPLARSRIAGLTRSWTVMHTITESSPLFGATPESLESTETEILITLVGVDDVSLQPVHARCEYDGEKIVWGARHADILGEDEDGTFVVDLRKFHSIVPTIPIEGFPYPRAADSPSRVNADG